METEEIIKLIGEEKAKEIGEALLEPCRKLVENFKKIEEMSCMTVGDLKSILEKIDNSVQIITAEGKEMSSVTLFLGIDGDVHLFLE
jgi:ATP-dependent RNA circularization protein (DNA/RNA ligase family)